MAISWVKGSRFTTAATVAKEVMDGLTAEGKLTPSNLVEASRPEDAPLHREFEWNDAVAAEKWREQTARVMIASIVVTKDDEAEPRPIRAFFHIEKDTSEYHPIEVIMSDEAKAKRLLDIAKRELQSFKAKYQTLTELAGVMHAIDDVLRD